MVCRVMAHPRVLEWYGQASRPAEHDYFDDFDDADEEFAMQSYHDGD